MLGEGQPLAEWIDVDTPSVNSATQSKMNIQFVVYRLNVLFWEKVPLPMRKEQWVLSLIVGVAAASAVLLALIVGYGVHVKKRRQQRLSL